MDMMCGRMMGAQTPCERAATMRPGRRRVGDRLRENVGREAEEKLVAGRACRARNGHARHPGTRPGHDRIGPAPQSRGMRWASAQKALLKMQLKGRDRAGRGGEGGLEVLQQLQLR